MFRVGQNHTFIGIYSVYIVFLAGELPYIRSYTVCICVYMVLANPNRVQTYHWSIVIKLQTSLSPVFCVQTSYHRTVNLITGLLCSNLLSPHSQPYYWSFVFKPPITAQSTLLLVFCVQTSYHRTANLITSLLCSNLSPVYHVQNHHQSIVFKLITGLSCSKSSPVYCDQTHHSSLHRNIPSGHKELLFMLVLPFYDSVWAVMPFTEGPLQALFRCNLFL